MYKCEGLKHTFALHTPRAVKCTRIIKPALLMTYEYRRGVRVLVLIHQKASLISGCSGEGPRAGRYVCDAVVEDLRTCAPQWGDWG
jgi:hypothetical protein